jgi:alcohol sulfotransferase
MVRDPRDLIVSLHFQLKKRSFEFSGTLSELLTHEIFGVEKVVETMNFLYREWQGQDNFMMVRYEDARADDIIVFRKILNFLDIPIDESVFQESRSYSMFENMKKIEKKGSIDEKLLSDIDRDDLSPGNADDPDSFKVRKGKVGGYKEYFTEADLLVAEKAMQKLNKVFGYLPKNEMVRENEEMI